MNCDFSKNLCDWKQEVFKDEIDFTVIKGKSLLANFKGNSGPISDRYGDKSMFVENKLKFFFIYRKLVPVRPWLKN